MLETLMPTIILSSLGLFFGLLISVVSKFMSVDLAEATKEVLDALPGVNCGACSYASCESYAHAVVDESEKIDLCVPGRIKAKEEIVKILAHHVIS